MRFISRSTLNSLRSIILVGIILSSCNQSTPTTATVISSPIPSLTPTPQSIPSGTTNIEGERIFLFGANYPWHKYGHDFGENAWGHDGVSVQRNEVDADFDQFSSMGIRFVRWFIFADGTASPDFAADGSVSGLDDKVFDDIDAALSIAQQHDIRLILVLLDFHWLAQLEEVNGVTKGGHTGIITDPALRDSFYEQALLPILEQYGQNPYILAWEIINEPEWALDEPEFLPKDGSEEHFSRVSREAMQDFISRTTEIIHKNADQWVTVGSASRKWWALWEKTGLDLCQFHYYDWMETDTPLEFPYSSLKTDLPCIVGEFPTMGSMFSVDDYYQKILKNGYAGTFPWSLRAGDKYSDLINQSLKVQSWAEKLADYILPPVPVWTPPTPRPTTTPTPLPTATITPDPNLEPDITQYGFEKRDGEWTYQTYTDTKAVTDLRRVYRPAPVYLGQFSLQLDINLVVGDEHLSKGEAYVDVNQHPPLDESVGPYNLESSAITCWVYLPVGSHGETQSPWIAFQVFAKDDTDPDHCLYGPWTRVQVNDEGKWVRISMQPRRFAASNGYICDSGFDPTTISTIGVKIGTDDYYAQDGVSYEGPVYIDSCTWK